MFKQSYLVGSAALLLAVAACDSSTSPSGGISQADANQLAADMDAVATLGQSDFNNLGPAFSVNVDGAGSSASVSGVPIAINNSFSVTKQCPKGGQVGLSGTMVGSGDPATHSLTLDVDATRTDTNCGFDTRNGVLTLSGNPNIVYNGHLNIVNAALSGLQTQTHAGSFTWSRTGGSGTCEVDLASSFDPTTHTATVTGHFCGHIVNVTRTQN